MKDNKRVRYWVGVASKDHVQRGTSGGFAQFCHGKLNPVKSLAKDDWIIYYSGKEKFSEAKTCRKFTAIGQVCDLKPYQVEQFIGFKPFRRNITYYNCNEIDIYPLIKQVAFIKNKEKWGLVFRRGFFELTKEDFSLIASKMLVGELVV